ncbi:MAG: GntR family transcriptional regulator [Labilithrix sp.]|nr:GntR family transcriptional regulator [Labilithrix sp.]
MTRPTAFKAVHRGHAADPIFEALASAILTGELAPGSPLPPERVLGEEFGVSRIVLRHAVHRLADVGLVRVRQGGASIVQDPASAGDIRLIGLYYMLDPGGEAAQRIRRDALEKQSLQGLALVDVCARRGTQEERAALHALALAVDDEAVSEASFRDFEETFWRAAARAGKNRIFEMEVVWWYGTLGHARPEGAPAPLAARLAFYRELGRRIAAGDAPTQYYLAVVAPQLDALFAASPSSDGVAS